jgi:hypothetical protein
MMNTSTVIVGSRNAATSDVTDCGALQNVRLWVRSSNIVPEVGLIERAGVATDATGRILSPRRV